MTDIQRDNLLAQCLEDFHHRRELGETPAPEEYKSRLGDSHAEFVDIVDASDALDQAMAPAVEDPLPRAFGRYTLLTELGRGSMGVVYEALDRELGRNVAVKILRTGFDTEPTAVERFRREAQLCAKVHHDHIVEIYDHGDFEGRPYYTMRRLHGRTLSALIKAGEAPAPRDLARGLSGVADGLHLLHTLKPHGIVHRDVKPSNVLVEETTGRYVLCDFGLARNFDSLTFTKTGEAVGTPLYMPPEQMLGKKEEVDARSDVYGLGATMYEALSGRPPFKTDDPSALWGMILTQRPRSLHELVDHLPPDCEKIVRKALEKRREDRHASAAEMRDDLRRFADGQAIQHEPPSRGLLLMRRAKRFAPAMAAALLLAVGGSYWWMHRPATVLVTSTRDGFEVAMDSDASSPAPFERTVPAGDHTLTVKSEIFGVDKQSIHLDAGDKFVYRITPVIHDTANPRALDWAEEQTFPTEEFAPIVDPATISHERGKDPIDVLYPRGDVRLEDLKGTYRIDASMTEDTSNGAIEFRRGTEVLYTAALAPKTEVWEEEIPAVVREAAKVGEKITWGYYPKSKNAKAVLATFTLVTKDLSPSFAKIDAKMADQPGTIRALLRARVLLNHQLFTASLGEALRVLQAEPANASALGIAHEALTRMRLTESGLAAGIAEQLGGVPADRRAALYGKRR